jgi:para-aminobenzoate synthetase component 1
VTVPPAARVGPWWASDLVEVRHDLPALEEPGRWVVALAYDGDVVACRFALWSEAPIVGVGTWSGIPVQSWTSSACLEEYVAGVGEIRRRIAAGDVYQVNLCRVLRASAGEVGDIAALDALLREHNPTPYGGFLRIPELEMVCASPELFLQRTAASIASGPIKGTARPGESMLDKDVAENIMITDLVRNDLSRVATVGSVRVPRLLHEEAHPGLTHLVTYVHADVPVAVGWASILAATFPPGSVTGAPKHTALQAIEQLETDTRAYYCGAFGWIDGDSGDGVLAVTIRTFWRDAGDLCFGTGAGITWESDAMSEWEETELKARHLLSIAAMKTEGRA